MSTFSLRSDDCMGVKYGGGPWLGELQWGSRPGGTQTGINLAFGQTDDQGSKRPVFRTLNEWHRLEDPTNEAQKYTYISRSIQG